MLFRYFTSILPKQKYTALGTGEAQESSSFDTEQVSNCRAPEREDNRLLKRYFIFFCLALLFAISITAAMLYNLSSKIDAATALATNQPSNFIKTSGPVEHVHEATDCGSSPHTALERGCRFDLMGFTWKPRECFDGELMEQFMQEKHWQWSLNSNGTELLSRGDIETGVYELGWTTWEYHLTHCLYMWMKLRRDIIFNRPRDQSVMDLDHSLHCAEKLLTPGINNSAWVTKFHITYPKCGGEEIDKNEGNFRIPVPGESED